MVTVAVTVTVTSHVPRFLIVHTRFNVTVTLFLRDFYKNYDKSVVNKGFRVECGSLQFHVCVVGFESIVFKLRIYIQDTLRV